MTYFPDGRFFNENGRLYPWDVRYDPADRAHCTACPEGSVLFRITAEPGFTDVHLVLSDGTGHQLKKWAESRRFSFWEVEITPPTRVFEYSFAMRDPFGRAVHLVPAGISNAVERLDRWHLDLDAITPLDPPAWAKGAVIYQIFPERFHSGDPTLTPVDASAWGSEPHWLEFQGGDLVGIAEKVDYLADLGVDMVYVNPIFQSPSTHRYDAIDFKHVDPALGGNDGLRSLVEALHARDIKLIVDASFNHCSPRFFAFADLVANGANSEYRDWFIVDDHPPRVIVRPDGDGESWTRSETYQAYLSRLEGNEGVTVETRSDESGPMVETTYESWYGVPSLPRINLANPDTRAYFLDIARWWIDEFDIDGWRMDVARYVDFDFWPEFRQVVKAAKPDAYLIAEIMGDASPWLQGDTFDATMDYTFRELCLDFFATRTIDGAGFADGIARWLAMYAPGVHAVNQHLLSSHDTPRFLHEAGDDRTRLMPAVIFQLTAPGAPGIYYGDEVGLTGGEEPESRGAFPWHDLASWDTDLLTLTQELTGLRRDHPALRHGTLTVLGHTTDTIAYLREHEDERVAVVLNRGDHPTHIGIPGVTHEPEVIWGTATVTVNHDGLAVEDVGPGTGAVILL
ncbi:MAG: alpha-glycosidase [Acidimicrobiia bacterium]|nr:alpha-glycosidase [Acidimicrobiia bacterium]